MGAIAMVRDDVAAAVLAAIGGKDNVLTNTVCMTRLRITLKNPQEVDYVVLNEVPSVLGTATRGANGLEVVFGPRMIDSIYHAFTRLTGIKSEEETLFPLPRKNTNLSVNITTNMGTVVSEPQDITPVTAGPIDSGNLAKAIQAAIEAEPDIPFVSVETRKSAAPIIMDAAEDDDGIERDLDAEDEEIETAVSDASILEDILEDMEAPISILGDSKARKPQDQEYSLLVLNGPNINLMGLTYNGIEEGLGFASLLELCKRSAEEAGFDHCITFQSNHEGDLVDQIQDAFCTFDAILINPGPASNIRAISQALELVGVPYKVVYIDVSSYGPEDFEFCRQAIFALAKTLGLKG
jgi:3-dehydroquinate dehydratase-2